MHYSNLQKFLLARRGADGFFESRLSDSAVSTAVACVALEVAGEQRFAVEIQAARAWLVSHRNRDGLYGDSPESPANLTATFLAYVALSRAKQFEDELATAKNWLLGYFGDFSFAAVRRGLLKEYGKDLTFSVPILALATAAEFFDDQKEAWRSMPKFPFEAVLLPETLFKYLNLPVVSYAIPALISVGLAQLNHAPEGWVKRLRLAARQKALAVLEAKQPAGGGFLEAAPLTGFCALCLVAAGLPEHPVTLRSLGFLRKTQRPNGAWPIDRDLRQWVTSLAVAALAPDFSEAEKAQYRAAIIAHQTTEIHSFTRSAPGGWAWTTHSGGVPDADDTSAALIALAKLGEGASSAVQAGIGWLLAMQNRDGGVPTFCRGWGKLPFDRSCPDLAAHMFKAFSCFEADLPAALKRRVAKAKARLRQYLKKVQRPDGAFVPLWFGDQQSPTKEAPIYGSAVVLEHLQGVAEPFLQKTMEFLLAAQQPAGDWGTVTVTARCVGALAPYPEAGSAVRRARDFLRKFAEQPETIPPEPIGLYFAHLWYSEELYAPIFLLNAFAGERE